MTTFYGLFQGDHDDHEGDATCLAVFSTEKKAKTFEDMLSKQHTELKRIHNEQRQRGYRFSEGEERIRYVPDLYWDIRPIAFDPRMEDELE